MQWIDRLENVLELLVSSVSAKSITGQSLTNLQYRELAQNAKQDLAARQMLLTCQPVFKTDISKITELLCEHEIIESILEEHNGQNEFGVGSLRHCVFHTSADKFLAEIVAGLVRGAIKNGTRIAAQDFKKILRLGSRRKLPGYEATLIVGTALPNRWEITEGLYAVPYAEIERRLSPQDIFGQRPPPSEQSTRNVIALVRDFHWGPAIFKKPREVNQTFLFQDDVQQVLNLLEIVTERSLIPVARYERIETWIHDILPRFYDRGLIYPYGDDVEQLSPIELLKQEQSDFANALTGFLRNPNHKPMFSIPISRLGSSLRRRGSLRKEDELIDAVIALEALYEVEGAELTHKLSTRAAWFLGQDFAQRAEIHKDIKDIYKSRSRVVHGRTMRAQDAHMSDRAFDLARRTLMKRIRSPDLPKPNWDEIVLGAMSDEQRG